MQTIAATEEGRQTLKQAQWMTESGDWSYQKWCPKAKKLILDASRPALQQVVAVRLLHMLHPNMKGEIVQTFHSKQHLRRLRRREPPRRLEAGRTRQRSTRHWSGS